MKTKNHFTFLLGIFAVLLFTGLVNAAVTFNVTGGTTTVDQGGVATVKFTLTEDGEGNFTNMTFNTPIALVSGSNTLVSTNTITGAITQLDENTTSAEMTITFNVDSNKATGTYTGNLILIGNYSTQIIYELPISITVNEAVGLWEDNFCTWDWNDDTRDIENPGDLRVKIDDIRVENGFGDNDRWYPFDSVEVDVLVDNRGNDDVNNIEIEWGLYDERNDQWVIETDNLRDFDLRDGDDNTETISFDLDDNMDVDLDQLDDGSNYVLYVRATGEVDDGDDTPTCKWDSDSIDIAIDRDFVIATNINTDFDTVSCGSQATITADIYNIGSRRQDDVTVRIFNSELGINEEVPFDRINAFDREKLELTVNIPKDAEEKAYPIRFEVYDDNLDLFQNDDDEESTVAVALKVEGSCSGSSSDTSTSDATAIVAASLESGGYIGEPLVVKATITNTGDEQASFDVHASGYVSWADSVELDKNSLVLGPGESEPIMITFTLKDEAVGDQLFRVQLVSDNAIVADQPVSVSIKDNSSDLTGNLGDSWYLWLIGALNVILIVIIIIVAIRLARK